MSKRTGRVAETDSVSINWRQHGSSVTLYDETDTDAWIRMTFEAGTPPEHRLYMICDDCGGVFAQRTTPGRSSVCGDCGATFNHRRD
ncbi:hypothetical protein SAMN04487967_2687 [Natronorubrum sediminis]|uniref:Small CPxCG-related zinc finger protein n=1 Tax=Natronorubrum sediminis TaxID=640943 RepID=A0A1H6G0B6_9EURY|nr:hypothetical protein [Natronorubrum sediminis]SEH16531.1 hypothetical protein SAMN04487967_2687 [Natronorubrum sediminis]